LPNLYQNFDDLIGTTILYMPVWTFEEIEKCRFRVFNNLEIEEVKYLFSRWGGISRSVLKKAHN